MLASSSVRPRPRARPVALPAPLVFTLLFLLALAGCGGGGGRSGPVGHTGSSGIVFSGAVSGTLVAPGVCPPPGDGDDFSSTWEMALGGRQYRLLLAILDVPGAGAFVAGSGGAQVQLSDRQSGMTFDAGGTGADAGSVSLNADQTSGTLAVTLTRHDTGATIRATGSWTCAKNSSAPAAAG